MIVFAVLLGGLTIAFLALGIVGAVWYGRQGSGRPRGVTISLQALRKGVKNQDTDVLAQAFMIVGFPLFVSTTIMTVGAGIVASGDGMGWIFILFGLLFAGLFGYVLLFRKTE